MKIKINSWNEMTLRDYQELVKVQNKEWAEDVEIGTVALLCGVEEEDILRLPIPEYQALKRDTRWITQFPEVNPKAPKEIQLNGKKYKVVRNTQDLSVAQYVDFSAYSKQEDFVEYLPHILSCFFVPEGKEYGDGYDVAEVIEDIKTLPIPIALDMTSFFFLSFLASTRAILTYSVKKLKKMLKREKDKEKREQIQKTMEEIASILNGVGLTE